jgi:hypothetical protein
LDYRWSSSPGSCLNCQKPISIHTNRETLSTRTRKTNNIILREDYAVIVIQSRKYGTVECLVDIDDLPELTQHCWCAKLDKDIQGFYIRTSTWKGEFKTTIDMQKFLLHAGKGQHVDHISGVTTDNRRQNLRAVSPRGNHLNRKDNQDVIGVQPIGHGYTPQFSLYGKTYKLPLLSSRIHSGFVYDTICTFLGEGAPNGITLTDREQARLGELLWADSRRHTRNLVSQRLLDGLIQHLV